MPELFTGRVRAPEFPGGVQWINAEPMSISQLRGKLVVLDFWTTCCINCLHILPHMHRLAEEMEPELVVIGVHSPKFPAEEDDDFLQQSVVLNGITHPVINDRRMDIWQAFGVNAWPTLMFIDPAGYVFARHAGEFRYGAMREAIDSLLRDYRSRGLLDPAPLPHVVARVASGPLRFPGKVLADPVGNRLFIADAGHHQIVVATMDGAIRQRFGSGASGLQDGTAAEASLTNPQGLALAADGSVLFVADAGNHALRAVDLGSGRVSTVAGTGERGSGGEAGSGPEVSLASPWDLAWQGDRLWMAMAGMHQLWTYDPASGCVAPAAGTGAESIHDGPLADATFAQPMGIAAAGDLLYVADSESSAVRRIDPVGDRVRRLVGRGLFHFGDLDARGDSVRLQHVQGIEAARGSGGDVVYLADTYNNKIKRLNPLTRAVRTIAGTGEAGHGDGEANDAQFSLPCGLSLAGSALYVADTNNHAVRRIDLESGGVTTIEFRPA